VSSYGDNPFLPPTATPAVALTPEVGLAVKIAHAVLAIVPGALYLVFRFSLSQFGPPIPREAFLFHISMPWIAFSVTAQHLSHFSVLGHEDLVLWSAFLALNVVTVTWFAMIPLITRRYLFYMLNLSANLLIALPTAALNMVAVGLFYI
jgi:hypothetical protein